MEDQNLKGSRYVFIKMPMPWNGARKMGFPSTINPVAKAVICG